MRPPLSILMPFFLGAAIAVRGENPPLVPAETYYGLCDASAVAALDSTHFVVGDDEDNVLRVYRRHSDGQPVHAVNLSPFLRVVPKSPEVDIEGVARIDHRLYWISSHGQTAKGKDAPSRHRFFATTGSVNDGLIDLRPIGRPYGSLLADLLADPRFTAFGLEAASRRAPKTPGALNIEGLAATPGGHLLIGFRNPVPFGRALVVPLLNPAELIANGPARFGDPVLLDLEGRGVRSLTSWQGQYLVVAGSVGTGGSSRLYGWDGQTAAPHHLAGFLTAGLNLESMTVIPEGGLDRLLFVSDDGTVEIDCIPCKKLKVPASKRFRVAITDPPAALSLEQ